MTVENVISILLAILVMLIVRFSGEYNTALLPNILPFVPNCLMQLWVYPILSGFGMFAVVKWAFYNEA